MNKLNQITNSVIQLLVKKFEIDVLWLVGSAIDFPTQCNDIDFLAGFHSNIFLNKKDIIKLIESQFENARCIISDDAIRFILLNKTISIAVSVTSYIFNRLEMYVNGEQIDGQHRSWATGYWIPEAFCADLIKSKTLHDQIKAEIKIRKLLVPYPDKMRRAIIDSCSTEITTKIEQTSRLSNTSTEYTILRSDIVIALIRMAFAKSRVYLRGFSHLERQQNSLNENGLYLYKLSQKSVLQAHIPIQEILKALKEEKEYEKSNNKGN